MLWIPPPPPAQDSYTPYVAEASAEGAAAMTGFAIPEGFELGLWAAEPMLANPVVFHVDHAGDAYVCESFRVHAGVTDMREHMDWLVDELGNLTVADRVEMVRRHEGAGGFAAYGAAEERVRRIRDLDGDGEADVATVFAGGFDDPADGIGAGVLSYRGDVFYACIPHLWRLRDVDGDGVADEREALSSGYGVHVALLGHDMHGLCVGPDGRLYWSIGDRGLNVEHEGERFVLPHTGAVLRCELDGSGLEIVHVGLRNPQELVFDDRGDLFTGDNNSDGGDEARWVQVVDGADSGWRFYYQYLTEPLVRGPWNDELLWRPAHEGQPAYVLPPIANLANGPAGLECAPGTGLPAEYARHFFLCDFRGDKAYSGIHTFTNVDKGAGFELGPVEPFVWNTLATDCQIGPDGTFYWSDWVHGWNMTGKGRIYRLRHPAADAPEAREAAELLKGGVSLLGQARLGALLAHADRRVRQEAHLELARRGAAAELARAAQAGTGLARLHGVWGLGVAARRGAATADEIAATLVGLLAGEDAEVRAQALRVLGDLLPALPGDAGVALDAGVTRAFVAHLSDPAPRARAQAALALGRAGARGPVAGAAPALLRLAAETAGADPVLRHAAVMGLVGCATDGELREAVDHLDRHVRMAVLLAMRRRGMPDLQRFLHDPEPALVREAAIAIHDDVIAAALSPLASLIALPAESGLVGNALVRRALHANLMLGGRQRAQALARYALRADQEEAHRVEALAMLAEWTDPSNVDRVLGRWIELPPREAPYVPAMVAALADGVNGDAVIRAQPDAVPVAVPVAVIDAWIATAGAVGADVAPVLGELLRDRERAASTRAAALAALEQLGADGLRTAVGAALSDPDGLVRAAGLDALGRLAPADALPLLAQTLQRGERAELRAAYRALGRMDHPEAARLLEGELQKLAADLVPAELALDLVLAAEEHGAESFQPWLERHVMPRLSDPELAPWLDSLFGGDAATGKRVFERSELSCLRCHQTTDDGKPQVGPGLSGVSRRLTRLAIAESIVAPNRRIAAGFETETFFLAGGQVLEGRVIEESDGALVLVDSQGDVWDVDLAQVEERRAGLSAMPANLTEHLTRSELRDLLEYLAAL
jgi:quinoprotein glucose dehydrogenase